MRPSHFDFCKAASDLPPLLLPSRFHHRSVNRTGVGDTPAVLPRRHLQCHRFSHKIRETGEPCGPPVNTLHILDVWLK